MRTRLTYALIGLTAVCFSFLPDAAMAGGAADDDLASKVTIRRDTYGVPHILAETEAAAAFGYGYAAAEDHVLLIGRLYLKARGEEAEYFGEEFAESDLLTKQLRVHEGAAAAYATMQPWFQRVLDGYARGFNRYVAQHRAELPGWVKPITAVDVAAHAHRVVVVEFCMNLRQIQKLNEDLDGKKVSSNPASSTRFAAEVGSNMWGIGSGRSENGNALLLGNPHLLWSGSHTWHEVHTTVPGKINFMGAALAGLPGAGLGFNEHLGWSHTVNPHDCDDIYMLTIDPADPGRYLYDGGSLPFSKETIAVNVKGPDGVQRVQREIYRSHFGPIVAMKGGKAYAFKSPNFDDYDFMQQWYMMTKTTSLEEFRNVLDMQAIPMFNIGYADADGNCFYLFNGRFPDRPDGYDWSGIVPGNTSDAEWTHVLPQRRLPSLLNPRGDYIQNSNSAPWYTNLNEIIDRTAYPSYLSPPGNSLRTQLGLEMIEADDSMTLDEVMKYKFNTKLLLADRVKRDVVNIARNRTFDGIELNGAVDLLDSWDNTASRESVGSVLFVTFWSKYLEQANPTYAVPWEERHPASTPYGIGDPDAALAALSAAVREMNQNFGRIDVRWGDVFRLRRGDVDIPLGGQTGDLGAFRVIWFQADKDGKMVARGGDSYVFAVEFSDPVRAYSVLAYSESDDPKSPHYTDQTKLFANEQFKPAWFSEADIARNLSRSYHP